MNSAYIGPRWPYLFPSVEGDTDGDEPHESLGIPVKVIPGAP